MGTASWLLFVHLTQLLATVCGYHILEDFSGTTFFDGWNFYGSWDNLTLGDVWWLNQSQAVTQGLVSTNSVGNAIIKVDNTSTVLYNDKRNSIRLTTQNAYGVGTVWIANVVHLPFGCSVWPALWTMGTEWPVNGEIDIIEGINLMTQNQMALHTQPGCIHNTPPNQLGTSGETNCSMPSGCTVLETKMDSYGAGFAAIGGGVFAAQFDVGGIFIWYWPRGTIPPSVLNAGPTNSVTLDDWGSPSASYPAGEGCNITDFFGPQYLVIDITLCGVWAGLPSLYQPQCNSSGPTGICYNDNVVGNGSEYNEAYFEISYVRTYTTQAAGALPPASTSTTSPSTTSTGVTPAPKALSAAVRPSFQVLPCEIVTFCLLVALTFF